MARGQAKRRMLDRAERHAKRVMRGRAREAALGLSTCHIRPRWWAECSPNGQYLAVRSTGVRQCIPPKSKRSTVTTFSKRSRGRMMRQCAKVDRDSLSKSLFVTLTYPREFPSDPGIYTRHFGSFCKRLRRTFPHSSAIWKLEFQTRGAAHYHLIVLGVPFLGRQWLSRAWYAVVGSHDERHLRAGTQVQRSRSTREAVAYVGKYLSKVSTHAPNFHRGRFWGVVGRQSLPTCTLQWPMERRGATRLARVIRHLVSSRSSGTKRKGYPPGWSFCRGDAAVRAIVWAAQLQ